MPPLVQGECGHDAPSSFSLNEPRPTGACAILVREDFLDAPLGTSCLLLDSLYVAMAPIPASRGGSAVLILHVRTHSQKTALHLLCSHRQPGDTRGHTTACFLAME